MKVSGEIFFSGCGEGLGINQMDGARNFVAEDLRVVPALKAEPAFASEKATDGWLASGSAVLVCENGTVAVHVDTRAGELADRAEVKCEMCFMPLDSNSWRIFRRSTGVAVGEPYEISNKSVHWDFAYDGHEFLEQSGGTYPRLYRDHEDEGAAVAFVTLLGWG